MIRRSIVFSVGLPEKTHSKEHININQLLGSGLGDGFINPVKRYVKDDKYSALNMVTDMWNEGSAHKAAFATIAGTGAVASGLQTSAVGLGSAIASLAGPGMVFGAVIAAAGAAAAAYKGINTVGKSYFPLAYHKKLTGK